jgi:four helix bundle protein
MTVMHRYQDFKAWQLARDLSRKVMAMTSDGTAHRDFKFRDNMRDAADSAQRNFPEGFGRFAPGDFAHFLDHSRASLLEVKNAIAEGLERGYFREDDCLDADALATRALKALSGLQQYLRSPEAKRNADRARARHIAGRQKRVPRTRNVPAPDEPTPIAQRNASPETTTRANPEPPNRRTKRT